MYLRFLSDCGRTPIIQQRLDLTEKGGFGHSRDIAPFFRTLEWSMTSELGQYGTYIMESDSELTETLHWTHIHEQPAAWLVHTQELPLFYALLLGNTMFLHFPSLLSMSAIHLPLEGRSSLFAWMLAISLLIKIPLSSEYSEYNIYIYKILFPYICVSHIYISTIHV